LHRVPPQIGLSAPDTGDVLNGCEKMRRLVAVERDLTERSNPLLGAGGENDSERLLERLPVVDGAAARTLDGRTVVRMERSAVPI